MRVRGGNGTIGRPGRPLINEGSISAEIAGATLTFNATGFSNSGVLRTSNGGILNMAATQFTNMGTREELTGGKILIKP